MALKLGWWRPGNVDEALSFGRALDQALVHRRSRTEPQRRKSLMALDAAKKGLERALLALEKMDSAHKDDPERREFDTRVVSRLTDGASDRTKDQAKTAQQRMHRWARENRKAEPDHWSGLRLRSLWELSVLRLIRQVVALRISIADETVRFPKSRPKKHARAEIVSLLDEQGKSERKIAESLIRLGVETHGPKTVERRVRSMLDEQKKPRARRPVSRKVGSS
jgi:hypothetical protein